MLGRDEALRRELAEELLEAGELPLSQALLGHEGGSTLDALLSSKAVDVELERLKAEAAAKQLPAEDERILWLAKALEERGEAKLSGDLLERAALDRGSWPLLRAALEALAAQEAWARAWPLVEAGFSHRRELRGTAAHAFLLEAHRRVVTALRSAAAVEVDLMMRGELDPFLDDHHLRLARALQREGPPLTTRLALVPAPQELREGEARLDGDAKSATGLLRVGSAKLRLGELAEARDAFERARAVAPRHFGLVAGLGAALAAQRTGAVQALRALPDLGPLDGLATVVPDAPALTNLELRVVQASVRPLQAWLPRLAARGVTLRILPLDARATDLDDFDARLADAWARLGRSWDVGGLAGEGLGVVKVETLFDLGARGWPVARELVHLLRGLEGAPNADGYALADAVVQTLRHRAGLREGGGPDAAAAALLGP